MQEQTVQLVKILTAAERRKIRQTARLVKRERKASAYHEAGLNGNRAVERRRRQKEARVA